MSLMYLIDYVYRYLIKDKCYFQIFMPGLIVSYNTLKISIIRALFIVIGLYCHVVGYAVKVQLHNINGLNSYFLPCFNVQ